MFEQLTQLLVQHAVLVVFIIALLLLVSLAFLKSNLKICPPNEVLIFSGKRKRVVKGIAFRWPIFQEVYRLRLDIIPVEIDVTTLSSEKIVVNVKGIANVKIAGDEQNGLLNAVERFLGKNQEDIARSARLTLEGCLRGVLATVSPEEANSKRLEIANRVLEAAEADFRKLGLAIDTFKIQNISDSQKYFEAIGRKRNALVQKEAEVTEAQAKADTRVKVAEEKKRAGIAEYESEMAVVEKENALRVKKAQLAADGNKEESRAKVAGEIARVEEESALESKRVDLNRKKYEADVLVPAQAQQAASECLAKGNAAEILENGKAAAESVRLMRQEWEKGDTRELFLFQMLPGIIREFCEVLAKNLSIDKLTIVDSGNGEGLPSHVRGLAQTLPVLFESLKTSTGLDIPELLQSKDRNKTNGSTLVKKELS
ncbi:MAG: hypothetical protein HY602_02390 [Parcubacteria group bacterium]|nr:hypothetical protein [Parcubacteria group bacterium]